MHKYVSVIVPAYNAEKTIGQCLNALFNQSYPKDLYEVIVVDDGSRDGTGDIAGSYAVKYIHQENKGPAAARNKGANEAKGGIILFTDSDCVPDADWISNMVKPFENPQIAAVKGAYRTNQKSLTARFAQIEFEERFTLLKKAPSIDMVDTYSAGFRRDIFLQMKGFDEGFPVANNEDTDLSYRMSRHGFKMIFNPDAIVCHLNHPDSVKRYARLKFWRGYWRMAVYKRFPDKMFKDTYTPQTLKLQAVFALFIMLGIILLGLSAHYGLYALSIGAVLFIASSMQFVFFAVRKDAAVGILAMFFLFIRAVSIFSGSVWGAVSYRMNNGRDE